MSRGRTGKSRSDASEVRTDGQSDRLTAERKPECAAKRAQKSEFTAGEGAPWPECFSHKQKELSQSP